MAAASNENVRFAEILSDFPSIWKNTSREYLNKEKRRKDLEQLAAMCDITVEQAEKKYKNLRTYYKKELAKVEKSHATGSGVNDWYYPKWELYHHLTFLDVTLTQTDTLDNISYAEESRLNEDDASCHSVTCDFETSHASTPAEMFCEMMNPASTGNEQTNGISEHTSQPTPASRKRKATHELEDAVITAAEHLRNIAIRPRDEVSGLMDMVEHQLRSISDIRKRRYAMAEICNVMFRNLEND